MILHRKLCSCIWSNLKVQTGIRWTITPRALSHISLSSPLLWECTISPSQNNFSGCYNKWKLGAPKIVITTHIKMMYWQRYPAQHISVSKFISVYFPQVYYSQYSLREHNFEVFSELMPVTYFTKQCATICTCRSQMLAESHFTNVCQIYKPYKSYTCPNICCTWSICIERAFPEHSLPF